ncbi:MAG TPA: MaoC/PaaZ C-terminal domain-containing protein [Solirubrobacteraceae bacterium]|nr:MaoC/PaaZ C-terminal domain-containing protein [Solirubrobacteraceae bacterium]
MAARTLSSPPSLLPLYARAAMAMVPGSSLLPFVPGGSDEIPDIELTLAASRLEPDRVAAYAKVCGFSLRDTLPTTYPHVLAFPLHMAVMADGHFPFGAVGLVHVENRIVQHRPIALGEEMALRVRSGKLRPHASGRAFSLTTEVVLAGAPVWEETSTFLRRGGGAGDRAEGPAEHADGSAERAEGTGERADGAGVEPEPMPTAEWRLPGDLGRRYAAVSGDRNPIHMHALSAKAFGFPRAIAHGMWTKARCLAALESRLPDAFAVQVRFRKPILLPASVDFMEAEREGTTHFAVKDSAGQTSHLQGSVESIESTGGAGR